MNEYKEDWINETIDISMIINFKELKGVLDCTYVVLEILGENLGTIIKAIFSKDKVRYLSSALITSLENTTKSIYICCKIGNIIDANVLARKFRDDLFQLLFILDSIEKIDQSKIDLTTKETNNIKLFADLEDLVDLWFDNEIHLHKQKHKLKYSQYKSRIMENNVILNGLYEEHLKLAFENHEKLDNYVHSNGQGYTLGNQFSFSSRKEYAHEISLLQSKLEDIMVCFISSAFLISPDLFISGDYFDAIERRQVPTEGMKRQIAPGIQDFFDLIGNRKYRGLGKYLADENKYHMSIE